MGHAYSAQRNSDFGPDQRTNTSLLSPYLRRRLVLESEVVATAVDHQGIEVAEKFVQEVFWRTYFKGWLERRPSVWAHYQEELSTHQDRLAGSDALRNAETGTTGIACFDAWARELVETNYLHNHARMWFASIWIFTLRLPWALGADFFMRHLLDGDPASNTLSWRWVAGLHTRGKHYVAAPWNIAKFTNQRFIPSASELAQDPEPLTEAFDYGPALPVRAFTPFDPGQSSALLITVEDCLPETLGLSHNKLLGAATLSVSAPNVASEVATFDAGALADAHQRLPGMSAKSLDTTNPEALAQWACEVGADQIVTAFVPIGPTRDWLDAAQPSLDAAGIRLSEIQRDWDSAVWSHATAGFFKVKKKIPTLLRDLSPLSPPIF